ncbi:MAG: pyrroline-5-carboxylate reductase [Candidatus Omnitrophica bacterium]|nr:pyrroline-5-carboxylate reductase [Candidatus Omnitrophota bacterium]
MIKDKKIGIIGCGNMGEAIFSRLATVMEKSTSLMVSEMDAGRRDVIQSKYKIIVEIDNNYVVKYSDIIILAVKPKDIEQLLKQEICCGISPQKLLISIAAGVKTGHIEKIVGKNIPVVRVMPNMPAIVGEAISSISPGVSAKEEHMSAAREIFSMVGDVIEVGENMVDAVTAISGSGPAYFFYMVEALADAAKKLKFNSKTAEKLAVKTATGSARLLGWTGASPSDLRRRVTSKGGTTEAALKVFKKRKFADIVRLAAEAACKRSKELSKG